MAKRFRAPTAYAGHNSFVPYLLNRVTSLLNVDFQDALRARRLTIGQWRVLAFLTERDGLPVSDLAEFTVTDQTTLSRMIARMERRGLVKRRPRPGDNRYVEVYITAGGRALFAEILPIALDLRDRATAGIKAREMERLLITLNRILDNLTDGATPRIAQK